MELTDNGRKAERVLEAPADFTEPEILFDKLIAAIHRYHPSDDISQIEKAYRIARDAHKDQKRKSGEPYIIHPLCVAIILADLELDKETIIAGILHDVVEDTDVTVEQLRDIFGKRIADLVASESDAFEEGVSEEDSWHQRKQAAIDRLARASRDAKIVALGDKLSNMRAIARDYAAKGDALWSIFHTKDPADHEWHYRGLADSLSDLSDTAAYREFISLINQVFKK